MDCKFSWPISTIHNCDKANELEVAINWLKNCFNNSVSGLFVNKGNAIDKSCSVNNYFKEGNIQEINMANQNISPTLDQLLAEINSRKATYAANVWVPSLKRDVRFTEMSTAQQKKLIKSIADSSVYNSDFIMTFCDVLKECCVDNTVNIEDLNIIDKLFIGLSLRMNSIGVTFPVQVTTNNNETVNINVNLSNILDSMKAVLPDIQPMTFEDNNFVVTCNVPLIRDELGIERDIRSKQNIPLDQLDKNNQYKQVISDAFIEEVTKYISSVELKKDNEKKDMGWKNYSYPDRIKIVEHFSSGLLKKIVEYYTNIVNIISKIQVVSFKYGDQSFERNMEFGDGDFFIVS